MSKRGNATMTPEQQKCYNELVEIINAKGGQMKSKKYKDEHTSVSVKCEINHIWRPTPLSLWKGLWCSKC